MDSVSPEQYKRERQKAKELKKSRWWHNLTQICTCYYCHTDLDFKSATMDHIIPISRGGRSTKGNLVPACADCNLKKRSLAPIEWQEFLNRLEGTSD